jgi:hypothetical protein
MVDGVRGGSWGISAEETVAGKAGRGGVTSVVGVGSMMRTLTVLSSSRISSGVFPSLSMRRMVLRSIPALAAEKNASRAFSRSPPMA